MVFEYHFLAEEGTCGVNKLLQFMTALDAFLPLGLPQKIAVQFIESSRQATFFAETCALVFRVPTVHTNYDDFKLKFKEACQNRTGFGCI